MRFTIRRRGGLIAATIAVLAIGAGIAYATIPDSAGVIHGCYDQRGQLRVIDPSTGDVCKNNEKSLDWSQTGPPGPPGQDGTDGTNGVSGYQIVQFTGPLPGGVDDIPGTGQIDDVHCPAGKKVTGGGVTVDSSGLDRFADSIVRYSGPLGDGSGWTAFIQRTDNQAATAHWTLWAVCVTATA